MIRLTNLNNKNLNKQQKQNHNKNSSIKKHNGATSVQSRVKHSSLNRERHLNHLTITKSPVNINNKVIFKDGCRENRTVIIKKQIIKKMCDRINGTPTSGSTRKRGHQHHPRNQGTRRSNVPAGEVIAALRRDFTADEVILQKVTDETNNNNQVKKKNN